LHVSFQFTPKRGTLQCGQLLVLAQATHWSQTSDAVLDRVFVVNSAIGGSTNALIHFNAIARHIGVELDTND
jgi:dihydroxyacid dehydratase/phosphogluconate dehydratase